MDSAKTAFEQQLNFASGNKALKADIHYGYGRFLDENGHAEKAIEYIKTALQLASELACDSLISKTANYLGSIYWIEGDCPASTQYYETALKSAEKSGNKEMIAMIKMNLSGNYSTSGQNEKAIEFALDALEIREKTNNVSGICYDYIMLGEIFQSIGNIQKWKEYVHKAYLLKDDKFCAELSDIVMIYNNLGRIAEKEERYENALAYYDTVMQVSKPANYDQGMGIALLNSALIKQMQGELEEALQLARRSQQHLGEVPYFVMAVLNTKAQILKDLGRYDEALPLVEENIRNENMFLYPAIKQDCLNLLYELNFTLKNYQTAYYWNDTLRSYEQKLRKEENLKNIEELETSYQTERKEQQIELLSAENKVKNQRIIVFVAVSFALLFSLIISILLYLYRKKQDKQKEETLRQKLLRLQMNPHFLFNALGSIQNYMLNNDTKKAAGYLNNFASLTRSVLEHSATETIMLSDEIQALHNYIKLEQLRLNHSFNYAIALDEGLETELIKIPPMLIQPFVENAIKHGLKNKSKGILKIKIEDCGETIKVFVSDNGQGFAQSPNNKNHKSMAMSIFNQRIGLLKKKYSKKAGVAINSAEGKRTVVEMDIPVID